MGDQDVAAPPRWVETPSTTTVPGEMTIAGTAWALTIGIDRVEISVDDGT